MYDTFLPQSPYNELTYAIDSEGGEADVLQYFMVDAESGDVALKKSVMDDPDERDNYFVSLIRNKINQIW